MSEYLVMKNENKNKKNNQKIIIIFLISALGIFLMLIGAFGKIGSKEEDTGNSMSAEEYASSVEKSISELCEKINGVSDVHTVVTLEGGYNTVYAQNSQSNSSGYKNEFVLTGSGASESAILVGYSTPQVSGVGIVCRGGGDAHIRSEIISLISATFGVSSNKIYVTEAG